MVKMVDIGGKGQARRVAVAEGKLLLGPASIDAIRTGSVRKGDVISASKLAGIQGAKATSTMLPLCHQIPLTSVEVELVLAPDGLKASCTVSATYSTGVEMEALTGVTFALLNAWDMVKYLEKDDRGQYPKTRIAEIKVVSKVKEAA